MLNILDPLILAAIIIGVTAFALGALVAGLIASARGRSSGEPALDPGRYETLLVLGRNQKTGKLIVGQQGRVMETSALLSDVERRQMEEAFNAWQDWLGITPPVIAPNTEFESAPYYNPSPAFSTSLYTAPATPAPQGSMIEQIDGILQEMLPGSPIAGQDVRVTEEPGMGVIVWVGARRYEGVDAVPDPVVQQVLHEAVNEWERRQPG